MPLTQAQHALISKARNVGSSDLAVPLDDATASYLVGQIADDLGCADEFPEFADGVPAFFETQPVAALRTEEVDFEAVIERLFEARADSDTYFACLSALHKARLKYEQILRKQPLPSFDQVGPRGLIQYGSLTPAGLSGLLFWRKWLYDLDNRAAQETGYLFEPIVASAIGGAPVGARRSPVRRHADQTKRRQVDCIKNQHAYEIKIRVTIAASGQGRWREELDFPVDCRQSNFTPVLVVFDPTPNPKLAELQRAFEAQNGHVYVGDEAWRHLDDEAGPVMSTFLEKYVRAPLTSLLAASGGDLPELGLRVREGAIDFDIGGEVLSVDREDGAAAEDDVDELPDDVDEIAGGP